MTAVTPHETLNGDRPPASVAGPYAWLRNNLFNSWFNAGLTIVSLYVIARVGWSFLSWAVLDAAWSGGVEACQKTTGACWVLIHERYRLILFGTYPYAEQWRPALAIALFIAMLAPSCLRRLWNRRLVIAWAVVLVLMGWLMYGGFGLAVVTTSYWNGLPITFVFSIVGLIVAFPLSMLLALARRSRLPIIRYLSIGYIEVIRGVPLISILFMAVAMFPLFMPVDVSIDALVRAQIGLILFSAAYMAEVIRAGLIAVPRGQYEAAEALGLNYAKQMAFVVMPQALKIVIPPLVNIFIGTFKNTTLVIIIGLFDLLGTAKLAVTDPVWRNYTVESYVFTAAIFFVFCFFMSKFSQYLETILRRGAAR
jgi:general L-amino acid transport system permease protein